MNLLPVRGQFFKTPCSLTMFHTLNDEIPIFIDLLKVLKE